RYSVETVKTITEVTETRIRHPFFFSSRRRHTRWPRNWSSDVCFPISRLIRPGAGLPRAQVLDPLGLAERAFQHVRVDHLDVDADTDGLSDQTLEHAGHGLLALVVDTVVLGFDPHCELIHPGWARENTHVVRGHSLDREDLLFDLAGEQVHAVHDHHVVGTAGDLLHSAKRR